MKIDKNPVVYIEWVDSQTNYGWRKEERVDDEVCLIKSVGIQVSKTKTSITISTSKSSFGNFVDKLSIPICSIKNLKRLEAK